MLLGGSILQGKGTIDAFKFLFRVVTCQICDSSITFLYYTIPTFDLSWDSSKKLCIRIIPNERLRRKPLTLDCYSKFICNKSRMRLPGIKLLVQSSTILSKHWNHEFNQSREVFHLDLLGLVKGRSRKGLKFHENETMTAWTEERGFIYNTLLLKSIWLVTIVTSTTEDF